MPKACWEPIPLPAGMYCVQPGLHFVWEAMEEHPQWFDKNHGNWQTHLEVSENKHTHYVFLYFPTNRKIDERM